MKKVRNAVLKRICREKQGEKSADCTKMRVVFWKYNCNEELIKTIPKSFITTKYVDSDFE